MTNSINLPELRKQISALKQNNNWKGIYDLVQPIITLKENDEIWNNHKILSDIGFAIGKLAETPKVRLLPQEEKAFRNQQKLYRENTELLRKRCIELSPENSAYHANLGYFHYQNINELSGMNRRDGNIWDEIKYCQKAIEKSLSLDNRRISEHYRLGKVLVEKVPNVILWGKQFHNLSLSERQQQVRDLVRLGIEHFRLAEELWENLSYEHPEQNEQKKRFRKEYIKTLYALGGAYLEQLGNNSDIVLADVAIEAHKYEPRVTDFDEDSIKTAVKYYIKCILEDAKLDWKEYKNNPDKIFEAASMHGEEDGVHKLYSMGKVLLRQFILKSRTSKNDNDKVKAGMFVEKFLKAAIALPYSPGFSKQNKLYVAECLAKFYLAQNNYLKAIEVIETEIKQKRRTYAQLDEYILQTLMTAYTLQDNKSKVVEIANALATKHNPKRAWLTPYLLGCVMLRVGEIDEAKKHIQKAEELGKAEGKENIDSVFIARSFAFIKGQDKDHAISCLEKALEINPQNDTARKYLKKWRG